MSLNKTVRGLTPSQLAAIAAITGGGASGLHSYMIHPDWRTALPAALLGGGISSALVYGGVRGERALRKASSFAEGYFEALMGD